ncbi:tetratricopeptide repeat-containing diguanylate cyclase [Litorilituus lipolyticus]|uniref:diguanylate cyclase n=1 Tax=Litorilituus lipolyticus TaxID=2491017 RepID=A0A502KU33_9GAMM|nr:tetratricopeptide repeat-containing diguanylate cyclase [Litorilituus lipolyticus]TPH14644.1 diguanylate cyclase [Litorilituus lipolyticus]
MPYRQSHTFITYSFKGNGFSAVHLFMTMLFKIFIKFSTLLIILFALLTKVQASVSVQLFINTNQVISLTTSANTSLNSNFTNLSFDELLQHADNNRSSNNQLSVSLINYLQSQEAQLSIKQQEYLTYLTAYQFTFSANYQKAMLLLNQLIQTSQQNNIVIRSHETSISINSGTQQWTEGLAHIKTLISLINDSDDKKLVEGSLITIAAFFNNLGQYQEALLYIQQINQDDITLQRDICFINQQQALANLRLFLAKAEPFNLEKAAPLEAHLNDSIALCQQANEPLVVNLLRTYLAELDLFEQRAEQALSTLLPNIDEVIATNYPVLINLTYNLLAQAYWQQHDIANTEKYINLAKNNIELLSQTQQTIQTYLLLSQLAEQQGNYALALKYHQQYSKAKQKVADEEQAKQLAFQLAKQSDYQTKENIRRIRQQNSIYSSKQSLSQQQEGNHLLLIILLIVLLITLFIWGYKSWLTQQKLKLITEYDHLTQVNTRAQFVELGQQAIERCKEINKPLSCIMFDLDHFKNINDVYGHSIGDKVLQQVSTVCKHTCRPNDFIGRIGGEEFAIILPDCNLLVAEDIAQRCLSAIAELNVKSLGITSPVTASFGISDAERVNYDLTRLMADADSAMYASKHHGRNCINVYR